ncbi:MAG: lipopolysaccharide biosynthesis protein [Mariniphaga sp.]
MGLSNLKRKAVNGFFWSMLESILSQGQGMIFGIFLARMLSPGEFGLVGMITIFISIAQVFVDSGLSQALIGKQNCTRLDYSTIFWANIFIGVLAYLIIWFCAPFIAGFYQKPELILLTKFASIAILIGSLTLIQQTILIKEIDFKTITKISTISTFVSGVVSLLLAYNGFGVWSLVWRTLVNQALRSFMMWRQSHWLPQWVFSKKLFFEHFSFGSNILLISIIAVIYKSIYNFIIGKNYSETVLGYYTNADQYSSIPSINLTNITAKVSFPVLSEMQHDNESLRVSIRKLIKTIMYVSFIIMFGLAAIAHPLFYVLFGEKWLPAVPIFQALCCAYAITPMHAINHSIFKVKGRPDLFLKTELIKYILFTPLLILGVYFGLTILVIGIVVFNWLGYLINSFYSEQLINYSGLAQWLDFFPIMLLSGIPAFLIWGLGVIFPVDPLTALGIQILAYFAIILGISVLFRIPAFYEITAILKNKFTFINIVKTFKPQDNEF